MRINTTFFCIFFLVMNCLPVKGQLQLSETYQLVDQKKATGTKPYILSKAERKEGFKILFDGTSMSKWVGNTTEYILEDGCIVMHPKEQTSGNLYSEKEYGDFVLRFDFMLTPGANSGLGLRHDMVSSKQGYSGMELQIIDNAAPEYKNLKAYQYHGSLYGLVPAKRGFLKPVGTWNRQEVIAKGNAISVILNGMVILDTNLEGATSGVPKDKFSPAIFNHTGHIAFLGHGSVLSFRNIRIKELK